MHNKDKQFFYAFIGDTSAEMMSVEFKDGETWDGIGMPMYYEFPVFTQKNVLSFSMGMSPKNEESFQRIALLFMQRSRNVPDKYRFCGTLLIFIEQ